MANVEKGRNKREDNAQDYTQDYRIKDDLKAFRRGKPQMEIYRPGSGPLRKSAQGEDESDVFVDHHRKLKSSTDNSLIMNSHEERNNHSGSQEHLNKSKIDHMTGSIGNLSISSNKGRRNSLGNISGGGGKGGNDSRKKGKKPEQQIYVPKGVAQAQAEREISNKYDNNRNKNCFEENWDDDCPTESSKESEIKNGPSLRKNKPENNRKQKEGGNLNSQKQTNENKRDDKQVNSRFGSGRKRGQETSWAAEAHQQQQQLQQQRSASRDNKYPDSRPVSNAVNRQGPSSREIRQGSEPRPVTLPSNRQAPSREIRQTSEPPRDQRASWSQSDKIQSKPPSGRRGSGKDGKSHPCLDALPPRLRRKYLAEQGLVSGPPGTEDVWDGTTVTFKGSNTAPTTPVSQPPPQQFTPYHQPPPGPLPQTFHPPPGPPMAFHPAGPGGFHPAQFQQNWSHTLPGPRGRGRGRSRPEELEMALATAARFSRSLTPERVAMVPSPPSQSLQHSSGNFNRTTSQDNLLVQQGPLIQSSSPIPQVTHQERRITTPPPQDRSRNEINLWDTERNKSLGSHLPHQNMTQHHSNIPNKMPLLPHQHLQTHQHQHPTQNIQHHMAYNHPQQQTHPSLQHQQHHMHQKQEHHHRSQHLQLQNHPSQHQSLQQQQTNIQATSDDHLFKKPATPPPLDHRRDSPSPKILDWSEEIEASEKQEAEERLSRRSSSPSSLQEMRPNSTPVTQNSSSQRDGHSGLGRERRRRRDKKRNHGGGGGGGGHQNEGPEDRSVSRNRHGGRHISTERNRGAGGNAGNRRDQSIDKNSHYQSSGGGRRDFSNERNHSRDRKYRPSSRDRNPKQRQISRAKSRQRISHSKS